MGGSETLTRGAAPLVDELSASWDAVWIDPSRSIVIWAYLAPATAERAERLVCVNVTDAASASWRHRRRMVLDRLVDDGLW